MSSPATSESIGVDIGGSKIAAALVAGDGTVLNRAVGSVVGTSRCAISPAARCGPRSTRPAR